MNLYLYHTNPDQLDHYKEATEKIPMLAFSKYRRDSREMKKREDVWASDPLYAVHYAKWYLEGPFPLSEPVIATNAESSYDYALDVLKKRFLLGEPAIGNHPEWRRRYLAAFPSLYYDEDRKEFLPK